jgi:hypothetical protein
MFGVASRELVRRTFARVPCGLPCLPNLKLVMALLKLEVMKAMLLKKTHHQFRVMTFSLSLLYIQHPRARVPLNNPNFLMT